MITTQIITKNNAETIKRCIESTLFFQGEIIVADIGSEDNTINICKEMNVNVKSFDVKDLSKLRNDMSNMSQYNWQLMLEPWEELKYGHSEIKNLTKEPMGAFNLIIMEGQLLTKELRFWHKEYAQFQNPVYENLNAKTWKNTNNIILSDGEKNFENKVKLVNKWRKDKPNSKEAVYYEALNFLISKDYKAFEKSARSYLFKETSASQSATMMNYYLAIILWSIKKDYQEAAKLAVLCLSENCLMAEFWCLLGDVYYNVKKYKKAKQFYVNAINLGKKRRNDDNWGMDLSKYKDYPLKMIKSCELLLEGKKIFAN